MGTEDTLIIKMYLKSSLVPLVIACLLTHRLNAEVIGTIQVEGVGEIYVWKQFGDMVMEGNGFRMTADTRGYLLTKDPGATLTPDSFWQVNLFDNHFVYDLNLSGVPCHCNAAGYFIKMPSNQGPGGGGDYYCDANYVGGVGCPEYDTLESNKHIVTGALHNCGWDGSWFSDCDMGGCGSSSWAAGASYCPGGCTINSDQEFWVSHYQNNDIAHTYLEPNRKGVAFNICDQSWYWGIMGNHYSSMVFSMSLWGGPGVDMGWMDGITGCGGECNIGSATVTFKNFKVGDYKERIVNGLAKTAANATINN